MTSVQNPPSKTDARLDARAWALLLALCGAIFLEGIDVAMLNVAVPSIRADLGLGTGTAQWVISAYVLGYGGFMLLGGRCADLYGRRRVFLAALTVFVVFSGVGGFADAGWLLVTARFVTGVSAAFMTPAGLSIITTTFDGVRRDRALVIYGATGAAGFTVGLVAGGLLTGANWRWVFFAPVILGLVVLVGGFFLIRKDEPRLGKRRGFDLAGALIVTAGMVAAVYGMVKIGEPDTRTRGVVAVVIAAVLLATFVLVERRAADPLLRLGILRNGLLVRANTAGLLYAASFFGFQFVVALYLQDLRGWSPVETGLTFLVMGLDLFLAPLVTPPLVRRFGTTWVIVAGFVSAALAYALFLRIEDDWTYLQMLPMLALVGVAFALAYGPLTIAATAGVAEAEQGVAGALLNTSFQFGAALGLALVTSVLLASGEGAISLDGYQAALLVPTVLVLVGAIVVGSGARRQVSVTP